MADFWRVHAERIASAITEFERYKGDIVAIYTRESIRKPSPRVDIVADAVMFVVRVKRGPNNKPIPATQKDAIAIMEWTERNKDYDDDEDFY